MSGRDLRAEAEDVDLGMCAAPGDYVTLDVTDTGAGMPPDVAARVLELFFTTKLPGQGTSFGIPMVDDFVTQFSGHLDIRSEPGHGTTVRLYLLQNSITALGTSEANQVTPAEARWAEVHETALATDYATSVRPLLSDAR
jgi:hypothetical protein